VATVVSEVTLLTIYGTRTLGAVAAAVIANLAGAIPSYPMSRYWIWPEADRQHTARQAAGYWLVSLASLVASSAATGVAADHAPAGGAARLLVVGAAYIATLVVLWVAKLAVYQLVLFRPPRATDPTPVNAGAEQRAG
jgi:putative flippase GtrA